MNAKRLLKNVFYQRPRAMLRHLPWKLFWGATWADLRSFGNSRLIRTSYIWLFLVPGAAKLLDPLTGISLSLAKLGITDKSVVLHLPTGWATFYFMSVFFAVAQAIYYFRCPKLTDQFSSYGQYQAAHRGFGPLHTMLEELVETWGWESLKSACVRVNNILGLPAFRHMVGDQDFGHVGDEPTCDQRRRIISAWIGCMRSGLGSERDYPRGITGAGVSDAFAVILGFSDRANRWSLRFCNFFFGIGLGLFVWTVAKSFWVVCRLLRG